MQQLIRIAQHQPIRIARRISIKLAPSGGYPLTVIPVEERNRYMSALERASVEHKTSGHLLNFWHGWFKPGLKENLLPG